MFELKEFKTTIERAKMAKAPAETGLTAEMLNYKRFATTLRNLAMAGLVAHISKPVSLTMEAQPPFFIHIGDGHMIKVLGHTDSHKWLGCMLCACPGEDSDVECDLQQAAKAFQNHRWMLQCNDFSIKHRLRYFEATVSSTAYFAAGTDHYKKNTWTHI